MITKRFIVEITCENGATDYRISKALREAVNTLGHKRFNLKEYHHSTCRNAIGAEDIALNLVAALKQELEDSIDSKITNYDDDRRYAPTCDCC